MPIYEYLCPACNTIFQFLIRSSSGMDDPPPSCPSCKGNQMKRVMSSFSVTGTGPSAAGTADDGMLAGLDSEDPRAMARAIRHLADDMGEELEPEVMQALGRLEAGEDPESIERELEDAGYGESSGSAAPYRDPGLYTP